MALTLDNDSVASKPGGFRVSIWRWARRRPMWPALLGVPLVAAIVWASLAPGRNSIGTAVVLVVGNWLYWKHVREHFMFGCINPAVVIQADPIRLAVFTNMTKDDGEFPVIKVIEERPSDRWPSPLPLGHRIATVALYTDGRPWEPHWSDFDPQPVEPVARTESEARAVLDKLDASDWEELESGLANLHNLEPGLHWLKRR